MSNYEANVHIILLNYNGYKDTIDCIKSLNNIDYKNYKIIVVDNNSSDNSEIEIKEFIKDYNHIHYIQTGKNIGFSGGNNVAIKWSLENNADYICLLNNDTIVEKDFLSKLVEQMSIDENIGISAGKIMYYDQKNVIWSAGGYIDKIRGFGCHYGINENDNEKYDKIKEVTFLTGCIQLIKREVFENIGLYDDEYFLYMEDVDFCKRAIEAGYKLLYVPESKIYHKVSASTGGEESPLQLYYLNRNRLLYQKKNENNILNKSMFYLFLMLKMVVDPFRKKSKYKYMLEGIKDGIKGKYGQKDINSI